jgi:hypothetical protein
MNAILNYLKIILIPFVFVFPLISCFGQPITQTIRGKVVDAQSQNPLQGVNVVLLSTPELNATSTDKDGQFRLDKVSLGRHSLKVTMTGYEDQVVSELQVGSAKEVVVTVRLSEQIIRLDEVVVMADHERGRPQNELAILSTRSFTVDETRRYAASINDPARMALAFAGVQTNNDVSNEIAIRGNSPRGLMWRIEGVEVPNPNHFSAEGTSGGGISIFSVNMLHHSDFFTGAFPAEYGNALSGVFDIRFRNGNNQKREYAFQAGVLGVDFSAEGPFNQNHKSSYLINYRYSTLAILSAMGVKVLGDAVPVFQDIAFKTFHPTKRAGTFSVWGMAGRSGQETFAKPDSSLWKNHYDRFREYYLADVATGGITHLIATDPNAYIESAVSLSASRRQFHFDSLDNDYHNHVYSREDFKNLALRASVLYNRKVGARHTIRTGMIGTCQWYDLFASFRQPVSANYFDVHLQDEGTTQVFQSYGQWKYRLTDRITLSTGLHWLYFALNGSNSLEPRAALKWNFMSNQSLALGYGRHSKVEAMAMYKVRLASEQGDFTQPNTGLGPVRADHWVLAYENKLYSDWRIRTEAYYQHLFDVPVSIMPGSTLSLLNVKAGYIPEPMANVGKGRNYGLELTLEKFFTNQYYILLNGSLYHSTYLAADGKERNTRYNGRYVSNVLAGREFKVGRDKRNIIETGLRLLFAGGNRFTPVDQERSREEGYPVYIHDQAFSLQARDYARMDVRLAYRKNNPNASHIISLDIQNVTNRINEFAEDFDAITRTVQAQYQLGLVPFLNYRIEF